MKSFHINQEHTTSADVFQMFVMISFEGFHNYLIWQIVTTSPRYDMNSSEWFTCSKESDKSNQFLLSINLSIS